MDFLLYEPEDFASNESYLKYYFRLNDTDVAFWQGWISNHPEKLDCIINADQLISLLSLQLDESELAQEYQRLTSALRDPAADQHHETQDDADPPADYATGNSVTPPSFEAGRINKKSRFIQRALVATAVTLITVSICFYVSPFKKNLSPSKFTVTKSDQLLVKINNSVEPLKFQLGDGSIITLQPGSVLHYPKIFLPARREVFLEGEAFFEVSKNKKRPFYVYCKSLVAHVLGTSFNIKTDKLNGKVEVSVSTGKVEVYQKNTAEGADKSNKSNGLILTPNQKAIYLEENNTFESSLVDVPLPISYTTHDTDKDIAHVDTVYIKAVPMSEILKSLEKAFGIEIEVENENFNNCHFSGDLTEMNLYLKLNSICQSVNATYEVKGTKILIRGRGCN